MICEQDKTFCPFTDCAKDCDRKLPEVKTDLPICVFSDKPECYETKEDQCKAKNS
jgi:hypothetical protein